MVSVALQGKCENVRWALIGNRAVIYPFHGPSKLLETEKEAGSTGENLMFERRQSLLRTICVASPLGVDGKIGSLGKDHQPHGIVLWPLGFRARMPGFKLFEAVLESGLV